MSEAMEALARAEDEAAVAAAQTDLAALERDMLEGGSREKLALAQAILAAQDIAYEPVRAAGLLEELVRDGGDPETARRAAETLGGRYDGGEPAEAAAYTALLDEAARAEKRYRKQSPGRLTLLRLGGLTALCAALALGAWFLLSGVLEKVEFLHLAALGAVAGLIVLAAARKLVVAGLTAAAVTGCLAAVCYNEALAAQAPQTAAGLFAALCAVCALRLLLALRRSRQTDRQEQARAGCRAAYDAALAYCEAGQAAAAALAEGGNTAALHAYASHWANESRRLTRARRRIAKD